MANFDKKFDSNNQDWETPQDLFDVLNDEFKFEIDLAADNQNKKCQVFFSELDNALTKVWNGTCWINPPYGSKHIKLKDWIKKAFNESRKTGCTVIMLIPARTNTGWWHDYCMKVSEIRFIRGRPKFNNSDQGLPQPLAIVIFKNEPQNTIFKTFNIQKLFNIKPKNIKISPNLMEV